LDIFISICTCLYRACFHGIMVIHSHTRLKQSGIYGTSKKIRLVDVQKQIFDALYSASAYYRN
jgi:hypothetical protein